MAVLDRIVKNVDVLVGNEEDLQNGLGIPGPEVAAKSKLDPSAFFGMIEHVVKKHPQVKIVATTLREVHSTNRHSWGAVAWIDGKTYHRRMRIGRAGSGWRRGRLRGGLLLRSAGRRIAAGSRQAGLGARRAADHLPGRHHHGDTGAGEGVCQRRVSADSAVSRIEEGQGGEETGNAPLSISRPIRPSWGERVRGGRRHSAARRATLL